MQRTNASGEEDGSSGHRILSVVSDGDIDTLNALLGSCEMYRRPPIVGLLDLDLLPTLSCHIERFDHGFLGCKKSCKCFYGVMMTQFPGREDSLKAERSMRTGHCLPKLSDLHQIAACTNLHTESVPDHGSVFSMKPRLITVKTVAWSLYDFADTAFSALFITFFFPILIKVHLGGDEFHIGLAMSISVLFAALGVPLIGAISDITGRRMPILLVATLLTALFTVLTGYASLNTALALGLLANFTHLISKDVYDAKMIDIAPRSLYGAISGMGVGVGYCGTIVSLAFGYVILSNLGWETLEGIQAMFILAAVFYIIFFLPLFFLVPDSIKRAKIALYDAVISALKELRKTLRGLPRSGALGRFLLASFLYNNGMNTVIIFLYLYGRETIGLGVREFFPVFALMAVASIAGSFFFGWLSDRIGVIRSIRIALVIWIGIIVYLLFLTSYEAFLLSGMLGGAVLGAIWTLNRQMIALISPPHKIAELFGIEGLTAKFSGALGPVIFGFLATRYDYSTALLSVLVFFVVGFVVFRGMRDFNSLPSA